MYIYTVYMQKRRQHYGYIKKCLQVYKGQVPAHSHWDFAILVRINRTYIIVIYLLIAELKLLRIIYNVKYFKIERKIIVMLYTSYTVQSLIKIKRELNYIDFLVLSKRNEQYWSQRVCTKVAPKGGQIVYMWFIQLYVLWLVISQS